MKNWKEIAKELLPDEFNEFMGFGGSGRRPDSVTFTTIETDVLRRDITINALFFDLDTNEVVDLVGGLEDLKMGRINAVGSAKERFGEDKLRILRAIRFAGRFGSKLNLDITSALIEDSSLEGISPERIRDEFLKGIKTAKSVRQFLELLNSFNLFDWIFPNLKIDIKFIDSCNPILLITNILKWNEPSVVQSQLTKLTYTVDKGDKEVPKIVFLLSLFDFKLENVIQFKKNQNASKISDGEIISFGKMNELDMELIEKFVKFRLTVTGQQFLDSGMKAGPEMGKAIKEAEIVNFKKTLGIS